MYISSGSLNDILAWFRNSSFRYLLLFAGGGEKSAKFVGAVFDEKETIDLVSSEDIAVFLFSRDETVAIELKGKDEGHFVLLPGERLGPAKSNSLWRQSEETRVVRIDEIRDSKVRSDVIASSITFTHQLVQEFDIALSDLPALVLLNQATPEPIVVPTHDAADVKQILAFLRDIRQIKLPWIEQPKTQKAGARRRLREAVLHSNRAGERLDEAISAWQQKLASHGLEKAALEEALSRENAEHVWDISGNNGRDNVPTCMRSDYALLEQIITDRDVHEICRRVKERANVYRSNLRTVEVLDKRVRYYERLVDAAHKNLEELNSVNKQILAVATKYNRKFHRKHTVEQVTSVLKSIVGIAKGAKDIADSKAQLLKLLGE